MFMINQPSDLHYLIICLSDSGSVREITDLVTRHGLVIRRIRYDADIDCTYLFMCLSGLKESYDVAKQALSKAGYQIPIEDERVLITIDLNCDLVHLALSDILSDAQRMGMSLVTLDADNRGRDPTHIYARFRSFPDAMARAFITKIQADYPDIVCSLSSLEENPSGYSFYDRYAASIQTITNGVQRPPVYELVNRFTHAAQALTQYDRDYKTTLARIYENGVELLQTCGDFFTAEIQQIPVVDGMTLMCFQLPGGGNIFLLDTCDELVMIDTGYGIYHDDVMQMFDALHIDLKKLSRIILTHGDTDHCGAAGFFDVPVYTHEGTAKVIETHNRAAGSCNEDWVIEEVYTLMINLFGRMNPGDSFCFFPSAGEKNLEGFAVLDCISIGGHEFMILESHGGHQHGLIYLYSRTAGVLFTSDTVLNLASLTEERTRYNGFAVYLVTSVNVDPALVKIERTALTALARKADTLMQEKMGRPLFICCGHGPVSVFMDGGLAPAGKVIQYTPHRYSS